MRLLTNPLVVRMALLFLAAAFAFVLGVLLIRRLRRMTPQAAVEELRSEASSRAGLELSAYHGVIQRLKEQEKELERLRQAERERAATTENVSEAVLSNLASGVLLFNTAELVRQANNAAKTILGYASPFGLHARDVFRGVSTVRQEKGEAGTSATLVEALEQTLRQGLVFRRVEAEYVTPAGERRVLGITLSPVRAPGGEPLGAACLVSDLTEITDLARQMRTKENLAALGEMSAGIAHEFKNSLATISGYAQMLTGENDPATVQQFAGKIAAETGSLTRIVTDFLKFARPLELGREPVDLRATIEDCARECGAEVKIGGLPEGFSMVGDPTALRQAFSNLLRNSAEASPNGARPVVEVSGEANEQGSRIIFRDHGCGIAPEDLSKIFIPFFTTKAEGTGLGLALVHRIVSEHGGTVTVSSDASGTTFTLSFPAQKPARKAAEPG